MILLLILVLVVFDAAAVSYAAVGRNQNLKTKTKSRLRLRLRHQDIYNCGQLMCLGGWWMVVVDIVALLYFIRVRDHKLQLIGYQVGFHIRRKQARGGEEEQGILHVQLFIVCKFVRRNIVARLSAGCPADTEPGDSLKPRERDAWARSHRRCNGRNTHSNCSTPP